MVGRSAHAIISDLLHGFEAHGHRFFFLEAKFNDLCNSGMSSSMVLAWDYSS